MNVLIFGSGGFVGRNVCRELEKSHYVTKASRRANVDDANTVYADLMDQESIGRALEQVQPEVIVNCAGIVDASMDMEQNIHFTRNILEQAVKNGGVKKVIISGSAGEYGCVNPEHIPVHESTPLNADAGYGFSKVREEQLALEYKGKYGIGVVVLRIFNPIGKDMADRFLISRLMQQVDEFKAGERESIELARLDAKRDYVAVEDVARAVGAVVEGNPIESVYNVGSGVSTTNGDLLELILENSKLDKRPIITETSDQPEPLVAVQADISRLSEEFNWQPEHNISDTVREIVHDKSHR